MQPLKPSSVTSTGKCTNPIGSKCVVWDGPEITCLDGTKICKGQTIEVAVYHLATKLCEVLEAINIQSYSSTCLPVPAPSGTTIKDVATYIIDNVCNLYDQVDQISSQGCPTPTAEIPACIATFSSSFTNCEPLQNIVGGTVLPVDQYAGLMAGIVCCLLAEITSLQNQVDIVKVQIDQLWAALADCNKDNEPVQPTCTYDFTADPSGGPVALKTAYEWLEAAFCDLQAAVGTPTQITTAISKECANLDNQERLSSGGVMSGISGWVNNPTTLADSVGNLWLTVCDMRQALAEVLNTCCFSICDFLKFGYNATWDTDGNYVDIEFFNSTVYTQAAATSSHTATYDGTTAVPAWIATDFPSAFQTNIVITLSDGTNVITLDTGSIINNSVQQPYYYRIDFTTPQFAGYDKMSPDQTITFNFSYVVDDGATPIPADCDIAPLTTGLCCTVDFTEGFLYECDSPYVSPCDAKIEYPNYDSFKITWYGLIRDTQQYYPSLPAPSAPVVAGSLATTLKAAPVPGWAVNDYANNIVYAISSTGDIQCRVIASNTSDTLTVTTPWDTIPDNTYTFYIANEYEALPFLKSPGVSQVIEYQVSVYPSTYDPNDPSTWISVLNQTITLNLATATSISCQAPSGGQISPNTEYFVSITAVYNCGSSQATVIPIKTPLQVVVQLEQVGSSLDSAIATVDNISSNGTTPTPSSYLANGFGSVATFPIKLPDTLGDTEFELELSAASPASSGSDKLCDCGLNGNPFQSNTSAPDYRANIIGNYVGYDVSINQYDVLNGIVGPYYDQTPLPGGPLHYITNTIDEPGATVFNFTALPNTQNTPPLIQVPPGFSAPTFYIKAVYDPTNYLVNTTAGAFDILMDGNSTLTVDNDYTSLLQNPSVTVLGGQLIIEIFSWNTVSSSYNPTPYNTLTLNLWAGTLVLKQSIYTIKMNNALLYPSDASRTISASFGDAVRIRTITPLQTIGVIYGFPFANCVVSSATSTLAIGANLAMPVTYACTNVTKTVNTGVQSGGGLTYAVTGAWSFIVTESYKFSMNTNIKYN